MYTIDTSKFSARLRELISYVKSSQQTMKCPHPEVVSFNSGWLKDQEWYKRDVWKEAQDILQVDTWKQESLQDYDLVGRICRCMDIKMGSGAKQNLLDWRETADSGKNSFKVILPGKRDLSEQALYQIFCGDDKEQAFNNAIKLWGKKFPFVSFLFFLKDRSKFAPVRPRLMQKHFAELGIETDCLQHCSWDNYQEYLELLDKVKNMLQDEFPGSELIDAHSLVWTMWVFEGKEAEKSLSKLATADADVPKTIYGDERDAVVKVRINQGEFRKQLLQRYMGCCLCGLSNQELLVASHIKPWRLSTREEKVDAENGLLLCSNHDQLFDRGFISFNDDGTILLSQKLSEDDRRLTNVSSESRVSLSEQGRKYMQFHREHVFKK